MTVLGEKQDEFIARCLKDPATQDITGDTAAQAQERRLAACFRQFRGKEAEMGELETKAFGALEIKDAEQGEVTAVVATLGVVDKDGDVLLPGSFPPSASVKMSAYGHDVVMDGAAPVGKGTITVQGDKAVFQGRFFMTTERGREAFRTVKELGADGEWSFGFPRHVKTEELTTEWRGKGARRIIAGLEPMEASPVFRGAGIGTGTLVAKAASAPMASVDGVAHPKEDFAYTPDDEPSHWKFPIFDAAHVRNALARFAQADLPAADNAAILARIHEAAKTFNIDVAGEGKAMAATEDVERKMTLIGQSLGRR